MDIILFFFFFGTIDIKSYLKYNKTLFALLTYSLFVNTFLISKIFYFTVLNFYFISNTFYC
jgi:hypothetical protein